MILQVLHTLSAVAMSVFVTLFYLHNVPGWTNQTAMLVLATTYAVLYWLAAPRLPLAQWGGLPPALRWLLNLLGLVLLPWIFLESTLLDYYQPLSLFDDAIIALAVSWLLLLAAIVVALLRADRRLWLATAVALAGPLLAQGLPHVTDPRPSAQAELHQDLFVGGVGGYAIYRIPALLVIPAGSRLASGESLVSDRLIVQVEARRDGALDTGAIDLLQRHSDDGGESWSEPLLICRHEQGAVRGKCGNATPVFDVHTGRAWLAYNLSGIPEDLPEGPRPHSAHLMYSQDGGLSWQGERQLPFDNLVFGPGHGVQKVHAPHAGRLVIPGNREGSSEVIFSDDGGCSWQLGKPLGAGNENEIAELSDGRLYMASRHSLPIGRPPEPNGRLFAISVDGGYSWGEQQRELAQPTPICQASIVGDAAGTLWFSNPAHRKARVQLTLRRSEDDGKSWPGSLLLYPGPAGYSQLGLLSTGALGVVYERGIMAYSERISYARVGGVL